MSTLTDTVAIVTGASAGIGEATALALARRKARVVLNMVRGKNVADALNELRFTTKSAAPIVAKVIGSAIANAQQKNEDVNLDALIVKTAFADMAPNQHMRRWRPRAQGRATRIVKGMSHITVVLSDGEES